MHVCMHVYECVFVHTCVCARARVHAYLYVCMCITNVNECREGHRKKQM